MLFRRFLTRFADLTSRCASTLVVAEHGNSYLSPTTLNVVTAATKIGGEVTCLVAGHHCQPAVLEASKIAGVKRVLHIDDEKYENFLPEIHASLVAALQQQFAFSHILSGATSNGKSFIPRLGAILDCNTLSDIIGVVGEDTFRRTIYAGSAIQTVRSLSAVHCISVRGTAFEAAAATATTANVEVLSADIGNNEARRSVNAVRFVERKLSKTDRPELSSARVVISGGRGLKSGENFTMLYELADKMNAAVGASRAAVDAGYVSNDLQVGQTGKIVAPQLYIAVGISGAIQHLAGMKDSKIIIAINKDADAPIFQVADYGLVADLFKAVPQLIGGL